VGIGIEGAPSLGPTNGLIQGVDSVAEFKAQEFGIYVFEKKISPPQENDMMPGTKQLNCLLIISSFLFLAKVK
jgi:hypothetical protein